MWDGSPRGILTGMEESRHNRTAVHESSWSPRSVTSYSSNHHPGLRSVDASHASVSKADVARLNDTLRASGLAPVPREADVSDLIECAVNAVSELNNRNKSLLHAPSYSEPPIPPRPIDQPKSKRPPVVSEPVISVAEYHALLDENRRVSLIAQRYKTEAASMERSLRIKSDEVEKLASQLQCKYRQEDQRAALAMSAIRDHKMPTSTLLVIENYQKQIASLESENISLSKRNASMMHRLKVLEEDRKNLHAVMKDTIASDASYHNLEEECENLKQCIEILEQNATQKNLKIQELESKFFEQLEQNNFIQKHVSASRAITSIGGIIGCADDPQKVVEKIKKMESVLTTVLPRFENFVNRIVGNDKDIISPNPTTLDRLASDIENARNHSSILQHINSELNQTKLLVKDSDLTTIPDRIETLIKQASSPHITDAQTFKQYKEIIHELIRILGTDNAGEVVTVARRTVFRVDEYSNFYKRLCGEMGLGEKASFQQVIDKVKGGGGNLSKSRDFPIRQSPARFRLFSDDSGDDNDLAFSREIIRVPRK